MDVRTRYRPRNPLWFNRLLRWFYGAWLRAAYRITPVGTELFDRLKPPYVVIPNHVSVLDPFMVGSLVPSPVYWVTSDGNMRSGIMKFLLRLVGSIPKSKVIPDLETVNWIVEVIRKRGGVVGIFAEGQACWDGCTLPLIPSTAKLLKLLRVPVVTAVLKGVYSSGPRWSWNHRRGPAEIEFRLLMDGAEAKASTAEEIQARLGAALEHDEAAWLGTRRFVYRSARRARHLELALFMCPECSSVGAMASAGNRLGCHACGNSVRLNPAYRFVPTASGSPRFATIREWSLWQARAFPAKLAALASAATTATVAARPLMSDPGVMLMRGRKMTPLRKLRTGTLELHADRLELATVSGERLAFSLADIEGEGVLKQQLFEFYLGRNLYQFRFPLRRQSALKWLMAVQAMKRPARAS